MKAEEFYKQRSNSIRELWALSPRQIEYIALIMEEYAEYCADKAYGDGYTDALRDRPRRNIDTVIAELEKELPEGFRCPCCGSDRGYLTQAAHCTMCAVTTEL